MNIVDDQGISATQLVTQQYQALPDPVEITPEGHIVTLHWRSVEGATGVRISASKASVVPATILGPGRNLGVVASGKNSVTSLTVNSPSPGTLLRALRIPGLTRHEGEERFRIFNQSELAGFRLVLTPIVGGSELAPVIAVPPLPRKKALPAQLVGGVLSGEVFTLPDLVGDRFKITLVKGDAPDDFDNNVFSHGDVIWYAAPGPVGLHIDGPDGQALYALGGPITANSSIDLKAALERHLSKEVKTGPVEATITLRSDVTGSASVQWNSSGLIERKIDSRLSAQAIGAPSKIQIPPPHPGRAPHRTVADITIEHHGMALHPISDLVPTVDAGLSGPLVRDKPVVRSLPPQALRGMQLARVAIFGWVQAETDLSLTVLGATVSVDSLIAPVERTPPLTVWFEFNEPLEVDQPVQIALTATRGAFGWIADPDPLVQIAVVATPYGERVVIEGTSIELTGPETVRGAVVLAGTDRWNIVSDQFCKVSIANAVMEFLP